MAHECGSGPKRPGGYTEDTNEAPSQLSEELVDTGGSVPANERSSVEGAEPGEGALSPQFEE